MEQPALYRPPALRFPTTPTRAYVVNVRDLLNMDLDLGDVPSVGGSSYTFVSSEEERGDVYAHQVGTSQRCRLRNIQKNADVSSAEYRRALHMLMCRIDLFNGWVDVVPFIRDRFQRLVVDVLDPVTGADLGQWLVKNSSAVHVFSGGEV